MNYDRKPVAEVNNANSAGRLEDMDREGVHVHVISCFPDMRIGLSECSGGWLGGWLTRLEYQSDHHAARLPTLKQRPLDYARDGRVFCGIELGEGPAVAEGVAAVVGNGLAHVLVGLPARWVPVPRLDRRAARVARSAG